MKSKYIWIVLLLVSAVAIGFVQENLKVNINYILETGGRIQGFFDQDVQTKKVWIEQSRIDAPYDYYHNHHRLEFLYSYSQRGLVTLKWIVTVVFVVVFMVINTLLLKNITGSNSYTRWAILLYAFFFGLSFLVYIGGKVTGTPEQAYAVSRKIVGGLQSMVPLMILLPATWLMKNEMNRKHEKNS